jgi:hypothetical protein
VAGFLAGTSSTYAHAALSAMSRGIITIPIENFGANGQSLTNVVVTVSNAPSWMRILNEFSHMGPQTIPVGEKYDFQIEYQVHSYFNPSNAQIEMDFVVTSDGGGIDVPNLHLSSPDGMQTTRIVWRDIAGESVVYPIQ